MRNDDATTKAQDSASEDPSTGGTRPTVFVSYSWDDEAHREWVRRLSADLAERYGLPVTLDEHGLQPGEDRFAFMEQVARADVVVIVCTPTYVEKANERRGGVGVETTIITPAYFEGHPEKKFIPVVRRRAQGVAAVPTYLGSVTYIDMTDDAKVPAAVEQLARAIWRQPHYKPPALGPVPNFSSAPAGSLLLATGAASAPSHAGAGESTRAILDRVLESDPGDWKEYEARGVFVYQPDPRLTISVSTDSSDREFDEPWVRAFPDKRAFREEYCVLWNGTPIREFTLVSVDGHRLVLPIPKSARDLTVTPLKDGFARLISAFRPYSARYDDYLRMAGFRVVEDDRSE